jgi:hypothetical protein
MSEQIEGLQHRLDAAEEESKVLASSVSELQAEVWKAEEELRQKRWELERMREKPGVKEFVLLEREVRELEERLGRREREYREELEASKVREEEERSRLVAKFESVIKRKNEQLRQFEDEMEKLIQLVHKQQMTSRQYTTVPAQRQHEKEEEEDEGEVQERSVGVGLSSAVPDYVALLDRLEQEAGAVLQQVGRSRSSKGKENMKAARSAGSAKGKAVAGRVATDKAPVKKAASSSVRRTR